MTVTELNLKSKQYDLKELDKKIVETAATIAFAGQTLADNLARIDEIEYINTLSNKLTRMGIERSGIISTIKMLESMINNDK